MPKTTLQICKASEFDTKCIFYWMLQPCMETMSALCIRQIKILHFGWYTQCNPNLCWKSQAGLACTVSSIRLGTVAALQQGRTFPPSLGLGCSSSSGHTWICTGSGGDANPVRWEQALAAPYHLQKQARICISPDPRAFYCFPPALDNTLHLSHSVALPLPPHPPQSSALAGMASTTLPLSCSPYWSSKSISLHWLIQWSLNFYMESGNQVRFCIWGQGDSNGDKVLHSLIKGLIYIFGGKGQC